MKIPGMVPAVEVESDLEAENKGSNASCDAVQQALRPLDEQQRGVVARLLEGGGLEDGVSVEMATVSGTIGDDRATGVAGPTMLVPLERVGVSAATLANVLHEGLRARKHVVVSGRVKRVPDHAVRLKFLEVAHKLRGDYPATQQQSSSNETYEARIMTVMKRVKDKMTDTINVR